MNYDQQIDKLYQIHLTSRHPLSRIESLSNFFLNTPYQFEPLGEGEKGKYSHLPLYRTDLFDCVTFVDTMIALAISQHLKDFKDNIIALRYRNNQIDYTKRTDWFTDYEWNPHMQKLGLIQDVTATILNERKKPLIQFAKTIIDKPQWYAQKTLANLDLHESLSPTEIQSRLDQLRAEGSKYLPEMSTIPFIPLTLLFDKYEKPRLPIWQQFPELAVVEIIRPNWRPLNPKQKAQDYGTSLNVSHLGIAIRKPEGVIFHHASVDRRQVVQVPLADYLKDFLHDPRPDPIQGIHIEKLIF